MHIGQRVRNSSDGQIGYLVEGENSRLAVRLDRKNETRIVPFNEHTWVPDTAPRLTNMQIARVCYEADAALRVVMGEYGVPDWIALKEPQRLQWLKPPEKADATRLQLYQVITEVLAGNE